jgi:ribosome maturation factor RimP
MDVGEVRGLRALVEPVVVGLGYELVGIEGSARGRGGMLRVYIDSRSGITIRDCERVSHQLSSVLDVEDPIPGRYTLEVSSPGVDRPLFSLEDFTRFEKQVVRIELNMPVGGRRKIVGRLLGVYGTEIVVIADGDEEHRIRFSAIRKARLVGARGL